jgi:iron complex transport system substrate-binding protein
MQFLQWYSTNTREEGESLKQILTIFIIILLGCSNVHNPQTQKLVLAGRGVIHMFSLLAAFPEALANISAIGPNDQGFGDFSEVFEELDDNIVYLEHSAGAEEIAALSPAHVLLRPYMKSQLGTAIEDLGISVTYLDLENPDAYFEDIERLGALIGQQDRAESIVSLLTERLSLIEETISKVTSREEEPAQVLLLNYSGGIFRISPDSWIQNIQTRLAGAEPVWQSNAPGWVEVSFEQIAAWNPQYIFIISYREDPAAIVQDLIQDELWNGLSAVQNNHLKIFPADYYSWSQPALTWILGVEWIARQVHEDLFEGSMEDSVIRFYEDFYGFSEPKSREVIFPKLLGDVQ